MSGRRRVKPMLLLLWASVASCDTDLVANVTNQRPFRPPEIYETWWSEVQACSSLSGSLSDIRWFLADRIRVGGQEVVGQWQPEHVIILRADRQTDPRTVKHEMLHDLLRGDPDHKHPLWSTCVLSGING